MIYDTRNNTEVERLHEYVVKAIDNGWVIDVKRKLPIRTNQQNRYLHVILSAFAMELGYTIEEVKQRFFKCACNKEIFQRKHRNGKGKVVTTYRSTASVTTGELTTAIERFRRWSEIEHGVYLPEPYEDEKLLAIEKQMQQYTEFL